MQILWGIISVALNSFATANYKKAIEIADLSVAIFKLFALFFQFFVFIILIGIIGYSIEITSDILVLGLIGLGGIFNAGNSIIELKVYKTTRMSELLPYENIDKLFIVIVGFFLYTGISEKEISIITLMIAILTIVIVSIFTVDFKRLKIPRSIGLFIISKILKALYVITIGFVLIKYDFITYGTTNVIFEGLIYILIVIAINGSFVSAFKQPKRFYWYRMLAFIPGTTSFIIGLFIIESAGIIIASLLGFLGIVFNVLFMKYLMNDTPQPKQIALALIVITMIGVGYYFK